MGKLKELTTTSELVKNILEKYPETRNSDNILYIKVCSTIGQENGIDINKISMPYLLMNLKELKMPVFETVRRTRQKIQAEFPHLSADADVEAQRMLNEETYRQYARGYCL